MVSYGWLWLAMAGYGLAYGLMTFVFDQLSFNFCFSNYKTIIDLTPEAMAILVILSPIQRFTFCYGPTLASERWFSVVCLLELKLDHSMV